MVDISAEQRALLADILYASGIYSLREEGLEQQYISGNISPSLADLNIDSLAEIELCVSIESELNVSFSPEQIRGWRSVEDLAYAIFA